jgi:phosphopantetheinyl transferase
MQAVESQTLILYHTDLRGEWPEAAARTLACGLPYLKRLALGGGAAAGHASLAGIALALRALGALLGRAVSPGELRFGRGEKPRLAATAAARAAGADFSISHSGPWVGCAAVASGRVGFDVELGSSERVAAWVAREAALKACGAGIRALREVRLRESGARCAGVLWHGRALALFPGASACVMTSEAVREVSARALTLEELFAR